MPTIVLWLCRADFVKSPQAWIDCVASLRAWIHCVASLRAWIHCVASLRAWIHVCNCQQKQLPGTP